MPTPANHSHDTTFTEAQPSSSNTQTSSPSAVIGEPESLITDHIDIWTSAIKAKSAVGRGSSKKLDLYGIKKLRELILELAVRGKLVPQDPSDEDANVLVAASKSIKNSMVSEGVIKKSRSKKVIKDEHFYRYPKHWATARIEDLLNVINGRAYKKNEMLSEGTPLLRVGNLFTSNDWYYSDLNLEPDKYIDNGDLIYAWSASFGPFIWDGGKVIYHYHIWKMDIFSDMSLDKHFSTLFLKAISERIKASGNGIAMIHMTKERMEKVVHPVPPLNEQYRIVAKVDELMALCDQLEAQTEASIDAHKTLVEVLLATLTNAKDAIELNDSWQHISQHFDVLFTTEHSIDQLKQTILQLAVMGKLVKQNPTDEPASKLLERITTEKAQLIKDKKIRKQKINATGDDVELYKLPEGWMWSQLGLLTALEDNAMCDGPFGSKLKTEHYINDKGYSVVRLGNIGIGKFLWGKEGYISKEHYENLPKNHIKTGDLIVAGMADPLIRTCEVPTNLGPAVNKADCFRLRLNDYLEKKYISHYLNSHVAKLFASEENQGMTRQRINLSKCKAIPVPLPPINEQKFIVSKVDELISLCDTLKANLKDVQTTQLHLTDAMVEQAL